MIEINSVEPAILGKLSWSAGILPATACDSAQLYT
jgi:hypothetical protein